MSENIKNYEEKVRTGINGFLMLFINVLMVIGAIALIVCAFEFGSTTINEEEVELTGLGIACIIGAVVLFITSFIFSMGYKLVKPNEARVLLLFGKYYGSIKQEGFWWVNPFTNSFNPASVVASNNILNKMLGEKTSTDEETPAVSGKAISLKAMTLNNAKQKVNDEDGNPIEIGVVVIWKIVNTAKAVFAVDNYVNYISTQADAAIRQVARLYPYDVNEVGDEKSLRGSSSEVAEILRDELQKRVDIAGIEIVEARISHLAYAQEIAAAMLQRQQAKAIIEARQKIVEGAVGMVEMALNKLSENNVVELDDEKKATMVSNLLVVLCGNKDAQPIVNSGSIY